MGRCERGWGGVTVDQTCDSKYEDVKSIRKLY